MFADFEKAFKDETIDKKIPIEILSYLSRELPDGLKYEDAGEGLCVLEPNADEIKLEINVPTDLPEDFKPNTINDLMEYIYRTQQILEVNPDKEGNITINDKKIKIEEFTKYPLVEKEAVNLKLYLKPDPFPDPFNIKIEGNGIIKDMLMQRQPYKSMDKRKFESIENKVIKLSYIIDEKNNSMNLNLKISVENSDNITNIIEALKIYQSFLDKTIKIAGSEMKNGTITSSTDNNKKNGMKETIEFWTKILDLEKKMEVKFIPEFPLNREDILWFEKLYRSFIEDLPYKEYANIDSLTIPKNEETIDEFTAGTKDIALLFTQRMNLTIWGVDLELYNTVGVFDFKISERKLNKDNNSEYILNTAPINKEGVYISTRHFDNEKDASDYINFVENLRDAKKIGI